MLRKLRLKQKMVFQKKKKKRVWCFLKKIADESNSVTEESVHPLIRMTLSTNISGC